jgi:contact-dependent growth inhibition (CDI) system CdiI-like immunity protein
MNAPGGPKDSQPIQISAADFPNLRSFLRGYFHQDMKDEYGSPEEAAREFCADASPRERADVAKEWSQFLDRTRGQPLEAINRILTGPLGSSCALTAEEVAGLSALFSQALRKVK